ncbi:hypothetical protein GGE45_005495 [Rhizobium aethiopicum]|uniref:Uncharacterized protein n=1 Tax=Rhizobium aethiopicum TaxID=1138170 RepID=A0A7W6QDF3_9HYPH|nr:hypothetical protein [Rhizobium aethiopicum]MBB4195488.1 hypothetical protein [Rhizobium aethiopicum]MBB4583128.1 hypothetical protein [Rhizobium aethiopicum]
MTLLKPQRTAYKMRPVPKASPWLISEGVKTPAAANAFIILPIGLLNRPKSILANLRSRGADVTAIGCIQDFATWHDPHLTASINGCQARPESFSVQKHEMR